ncbi:MAG: hypothetical protein IJ143_07275 [Neisseriaceae bacterium]|nr:hypothetical protein [Neisseriaceae bacterium]
MHKIFAKLNLKQKSVRYRVGSRLSTLPAALLLNSFRLPEKHILPLYCVLSLR